MLEPEIKMLKRIDITRDDLYGGDAGSSDSEKEGGQDMV
jgi:hypothetical protein